MRVRLAAEISASAGAGRLLSVGTGLPRHALSLAVMLAYLASADMSRAQPASALNDSFGTAAAGFQRLLIPLTVNATPRQPTTALIQGSDIWISLRDLEASGMLPGLPAPALLHNFRGLQYLRLNDAGNLLSHRFDETELSLSVDLKAEAMSVNAYSLRPPGQGRTPQERYAPSAYINYSVTGSQGGAPSVFLEATGSLQGHTLQGYFTRDNLGRAYRGPVSLTLNNEPARRQIMLGDTLWTGAGLLGSVPLGGVTLQSFFGYEPGFVSTPSLDLRGYAATPSTVDVLVNGVLVGQRQLPAGPFELGSIVAQSGRNNVTAIVRDAFGRETLINGGSLYGSPLLLSPGLTTYSISAGRLRQDRFGQGPAYGESVLLAQASRGFANAVTAGAAIQASGKVRAVSAQVATTGDLGEAGGQLAGSHSAAGSGMALSMSYRLSTPVWSLGAALVRRQSSFAELQSSDALPSRLLQSGELSFGRRILSVDWGLRFTATSDASARKTRRASLTATRRWTPRLSTSVDLSRSFGEYADTTLFLLASYALDETRNASLGTTRTGQGLATTVEFSQTPQEALSTGYRLSSYSTQGGGQGQLAQVTRDTSFGDYQLQASRMGGQTQLTGRASGAVVAMGGIVAATTPIRDAFALVRVPDIPKVPVRVEGRFSGNTDSRGVLVVPNIGSYSRQRVGIDTDALPLDYEVGDVERRISPPLRGGEMVQFEVTIYRAVVGRLVDTARKPLNSVIIVLGDGRRVATGTAGDFVVEGDPPLGAARVERAGQALPLCSVQFPPAPAGAPAVRRLGELRCEP